MDESSPFFKFNGSDGNGDGLQELAPNSPLPLDDSDFLSPVPNPDPVPGEFPVDGATSVTVGFPVAILLPDAGPYALTIGIAIPGIPDAIAIPVTQAIADSIRHSLTLAQSLAGSGGELPTS